MKKYKLFSFIAAAFMFAATACTPDTFDLGGKDVAPTDLVEGIAYTITPDPANPNRIFLENKMSGYSPIWIHPQGRSQAQKVTLEIAFEGEYKVLFGVQTRGGIVMSRDTATFTIDEFYPDFVSDPMWTMLTGGVGNSKTWYLDVDAEGLSRMFAGPIHYMGVDDKWENIHDATDDDGWFKENPDGGDTWGWMPDLAGNSWLMAKADVGTMTFNLISGANVLVNHLTISSLGNQTGTFIMDVNNHELHMTDAAILHNSNMHGNVLAADWSNPRILALTEDYLRLGVLRDPVLSGEGACLLVYNFISEEYRDNWVPGEPVVPEPQLPDGWEDDISQNVTTTIKWVLSDQTPFDWCGLAGNRLNPGWSQPSDYPSWIGGTVDPAAYANFSMTLNSVTKEAAFVLPDGTEVSCGYTLNEKGIYTFGEAVPQFTIVGNFKFNNYSAANDQLRIMSIQKSGGRVTGMWLGAKDPSKDEYLAYRLTPQAGGGGEPPIVEPPLPQATLLPVDNGKIVFKKEGNDARIELFNEWGDTKADPPINTADVAFTRRLEVTFTLSGITGAATSGSYPAMLGFADTNWAVQYWGDGVGDNRVTGNGTYTVYFDGAGAVAAGTGVMVFVIDMKGMWADIDTPAGVTAKIDCIHMY